MENILKKAQFIRINAIVMVRIIVVLSSGIVVVMHNFAAFSFF